MLEMSKNKKIFILNFDPWAYTEQRQCGRGDCLKVDNVSDGLRDRDKNKRERR